MSFINPEEPGVWKFNNISESIQIYILHPNFTPEYF